MKKNTYSTSSLWDMGFHIKLGNLHFFQFSLKLKLKIEKFFNVVKKVSSINFFLNYKFVACLPFKYNF